MDPGSSSQDTPAQIGIMAQQIVSASKVLNDLIEYLPDSSSTEDEQLQAIVALQVENDKIGEELREMQRVAESELQKVQAFFGVLADDALQRHSQPG